MASRVAHPRWLVLGNRGAARHSERAFRLALARVPPPLRCSMPLAARAPVKGAYPPGPQRPSVTLAPGPSPPLERGGDGSGRTQQEAIRGIP